MFLRSFFHFPSVFCVSAICVSVIFVSATFVSVTSAPVIRVSASFYSISLFLFSLLLLEFNYRSIEKGRGAPQRCGQRNDNKAFVV